VPDLSYGRVRRRPGVTMVSTARFVLLFLVLVACTSGALVSTDPDTVDLEAAVDEVAALCGEDRVPDRDRLRGLTGDQLRAQLRDRDMDRLFEGCGGLEMGRTSVSADGDRARIEARYRAPGRWGDGTCEVAYAHEADGWQPRALPDCPWREG